jgi:DNA-binding CsgD family transcriptional regulator/GAF domain-containing protein
VTRDTPLSSREIEIANLYAGGSTYQVIAIQLYIAPSTVRTHIATIYRKLAISSKLALKARLDDDFILAHPENDQDAVIAELSLTLEESILREKMLSTVLSIIKRSEGDPDTVLSSIMEYALKLCKAEYGLFMEFSGNGHFGIRHSEFVPEPLQRWLSETEAFRTDQHSSLRCLSEHKEVAKFLDILTHDYDKADDPLHHAIKTLGGARSVMVIPMLADSIMVGAFMVFRQELRPFTQEAMALAAMFVDQSGVAIGNARMISALRADK